MATVGILGGMGPLAAIIFNGMLINTQQVEAEQEYLDVLLYNKASIPDRSAFILGDSTEDPTDSLTHAAQTLEKAGADFIAIPCITAHYFYDTIASAVDIPVINAVDEVARYIAGRQFDKVGIMATDGSLHARIFHNALEKYEIEVLAPEAEEQKYLMNLIYKIKQGMKIDGRAFDTLEDQLFQRGARSVVLGCTELSMVTGPFVHEHVDCLAVLARAVLRLAKAVSKNA